MLKSFTLSLAEQQQLQDIPLRPTQPHYHHQQQQQQQQEEEEEQQNDPPEKNTHPSQEIQEIDPLYKPILQSGIFGTAANLVNAIVGAGIIGIPYALKQSGFLTGVLLLIFVTILTEKSLRIIVGLASFHPLLSQRNVRTFENLASYPFDRWGRYFILVNMLIIAYGAMMAYLLIIKDTVPTVFHHIVQQVSSQTQDDKEDSSHSTTFSNLVLIVTSLFVILPLALQRDMASLSCTSFFSVLADVILLLFILLYSPVQHTVQEAGGFHQVLTSTWIAPTLFIGLGILSTAMACQHSAFIVSDSLVQKTPSRWAKVTLSSLVLSGVLTAMLGIVGYLGFLQDTQGDILNNFEKDSVIVNVARTLLAITMFFTYPMESMVARHVLVVLLWKGDLDGEEVLPSQHHHGQEIQEEGEGENGNGNENESKKTTRTTTKGYFSCTFHRRQLLSFSIYIATLIPAILFHDIGPVLSITGSLGGSCLCYIAPGFCYLGVNGHAFLSWVLDLLHTYPTKKSLPTKIPPVSEVDLPIEGQSIHTRSELDIVSTLRDTPKPLWWYLGGFPFWCAIASYGKQNMMKKGCGSSNTNDPSPARTENTVVEMMNPSTGDYLYAMVFIIFGIISAIAGVVSNVWSLLQ